MKLAPRLLLLLLLVFGVARAVQFFWVCDDAFISLRYAENLLEGHGLVYNAGERVEGYTNLLWTLLLAGLMRLGVPDLAAAGGAGIVCYLGLAASLAYWSWRRARDGGGVFLPLAAGIVLVSEDFQAWATGGLETMLFVWLATQALLLTRLPCRTWRTPLLAGALLALLLLTRPDGLLFAVPAVLSFWTPPGRFSPQTRLRHSLVCAAPVLAILAVLVPWKLAYYGDLFPTAFYAKSATRPYLSQGLTYLLLFPLRNWFLLAACVLALFARPGPAAPDDARRWDGRFLLASGSLFAAYIVWVGGDFMFARQLLPAVSLVLLALEERLARWPLPRARAAVVAALLLAAALPLPLFHGGKHIENIGDERASYPREFVDARRRQGEAVGSALEGLPVRVAFEGGMCMFGYFSRLPYLVEMTGLTQTSLAKRPLERRGVIGHEKAPDPEWLSENQIHLIMSRARPPLSRPAQLLKLDEIYFGDVARARIHIYSDAVMDPLRGRSDVDFVPIERVIAGSRKQMQEVSLAEAEQIHQELQRFYFDSAGQRGEAWNRELHEILEQKRNPRR